jgi:ubiquinone biosynthesis protein
LIAGLGTAWAVIVADLFGPGLFVSLLGSLVVAMVAARLLGARRSVLSNVASGVIGWLAGFGISSVIAQSQPNPAAGFMRNVWLFSTVFAMSATVWVELLARPGTLARAQSGLARPPRPLRALRRRAHRVARYAQITRIAVRYGLEPVLGLSRSAAPAESGDRVAPTAVRLRRALEDCGGIFIKLGQVLSTRTDLLPASTCDELASLQDAVAPEPASIMQQVLEAELGRPVGEVFADFDWTPIAAASIGQAYRARLCGGEPVVVKLRRPGIAEAITRDIDVLDEFARMIEDRTSWGREYRVRELAAEFAERLRGELDFRAEARNAAEIGGAMAPDGPIRVPRVHQDLGTARLLVMEWFDGVNVRHNQRLPEARRRELADDLLRNMLQQILTDGRFHADPHPGNVLVLHDDKLGLIDFGAAGRLDPLQQAALRDVLVGVAQRDPAALCEAVLRVSEPRRDLDEQALERALARFTARQLGPGATPSAQMLTELLQLCFGFGLTLAPELSTVFRALGTLEGTLRVLAPGYLAIEAAQRIATEWARERAGPAALPELARDELLRLLPVLRRLPSHVDRLAAQAQRGQLHLRIGLFGDEPEQRFLTRLTNRLVLAFLGGMVGLLSVVLLGTPGGPPFTGDTTLFQFLGYFGLFCATVLILRVLVAVLRDRSN